MKVRVISALVGILLFIAVVYWAPQWVTLLAFSLLCALAAYEFLHNTGLLKGSPLLLFVNSWSVGMVLERNPGLKLSEFGNMDVLM